MDCDICQGNGKFNEPIAIKCDSCLFDNKFSTTVVILKHQWVHGRFHRRYSNSDFQGHYMCIKSEAKRRLKEVK